MKVTSINTPKTQEDEFIEIQSDTGTAFQRWSVRHMTMLQQVCRPGSEAELVAVVFIVCLSVCLSLMQVMANMMSLSGPELRLQGLFLVIVWFCLAFRSAAGLSSAFRNEPVINGGLVESSGNMLVLWVHSATMAWASGSLT